MIFLVHFSSYIYFLSIYILFKPTLSKISIYKMKKAIKTCVFKIIEFHINIKFINAIKLEIQ